MDSHVSIPDINPLGNLDFLRVLQSVRQRKGTLCDAMRQLRDEEIRGLEAGGNSAQDWNALRVGRGFSFDHISNSRFFGTCFLGAFDGSCVDVGASLSLPSGIHDSIVVDSIIGDGCCLWNAKGVNNYFIEESAVLYNVGTLSCSPSAVFGNGREIVIGIETGGREVLSFADMTIAIAQRVAMQRNDIEAYRRSIASYVELVSIGHGVVGAGSRICNCPRIVDAFIGAGARCDNAMLIEDATILSSLEEPTRIEDGAYVRRSCLQWGCHVSSMAIVDDSVLSEHSHVERHGKVTHSIIGPNTGIAEGEVTASLVGPFVGFHHQSLLIGALWPDGKGNVGYGANVGSNHTSKAPDQEIYCGEGLFFGLGVNIKFPADYSRAPYSIIATGVTTLPQRVTFPFSLINTPSRQPNGVPPAWNELSPAWVLSDNLYAVQRNEGKYVRRNMARRCDLTFEVFRPEIVDLMVEARDTLRGTEAVKDYYTEADIRGIGKNFVTRRSLTRGIDAYSQYIEQYCLAGLFLECSKRLAAGTPVDERAILTSPGDSVRWEHERALIVAEGFDRRTLLENLERLAVLVTLAMKAVVSAKEKDDVRGRAIMVDYAATHTPAVEDGFVKETLRKTETLKKGIATLIGQL